MNFIFLVDFGGWGLRLCLVVVVAVVVVAVVVAVVVGGGGYEFVGSERDENENKK